jgi:hypothetical protein
MKVIIIKDKPSTQSVNIIAKVKENYEGIVMTADHNSKIDELINEVLNVKEELLSEIEKLNQSLNETMFDDLLVTLDQKKGKELIFIYINNEDNIEILEKKYQTLTVDKDFIFDEYDPNDKALKLISKLVF